MYIQCAHTMYPRTCTNSSPGPWTYSAVAVPSRPPHLPRQAAHDPVDWQRLRVSYHSPRGNSQTVGGTQEQAADEL